MAGRAPTNWEIIAAIKSILEADSDLTTWFLAQVSHGLKVTEYDPAITPVRLQVGVEISKIYEESRDKSCTRFISVFDLHVYETGSNTATVNEALGRLESAIVEKTALVDAHASEWDQVAMRNIRFNGRIGQAPVNDGFTVATTFEALTYYH